MIWGKQVAAIIPARGGSQRLPRKNIVEVWGKPMLFWAVKACKDSRYVDSVYVSTEDGEIAKLAQEFDASVITRPKRLAESTVFKQDVIVHAVSEIDNGVGIVVSVQPNSPEIQSADIDSALEMLVERNLNEVFSVGKDFVQNAAFRIMKRDYVFQKSLSTYCGVFVTDYTDIHTAEDLKAAQRRQPAHTRKSNA